MNENSRVTSPVICVLSNPPMNDSSKHQKIARALALRIRAGEFTLLPSTTQLMIWAKRVLFPDGECSLAPVRQALRALEREGLIKQDDKKRWVVVSGTISKAGRSSTPPLIGMIFPHLRQGELFVSIVGEIVKLSHRKGIELWPGSMPSEHKEPKLTVEDAKALCGRFIEGGVRGVFFVPFEHLPNREDANKRIAKQLNDVGIHVVLIDRDLAPFPKRSDFDLVGIDNFGGGYLLAEYLMKDCSRKRLAYVSRPATATTVDARIAGARTAILDRRAEMLPNFLHEGDPTNKAFVKKLMASEPDAILCSNDHLAACRT